MREREMGEKLGQGNRTEASSQVNPRSKTSYRLGNCEKKGCYLLKRLRNGERGSTQ